MAKAYGIDLGTTYSVIATLGKNGTPEVIDNYDDDSQTLASAVYFEPTGEIVVGESAKSEAEAHPDCVVQFVKREIGRDDAIVRHFEGFEGMEFDPITISSLILKRMKEYVEDQGNDEVKNVVITCPAAFNMAQREATKQAGIMAGFNVLDVINEPTAAALNYCCREFGEDRKILVYDLGGGTFDATLIDYSLDEDEKATVKTIDSMGDSMLGGIDWDARLYDYICEVYCDETAQNLSDVEDEIRPTVMRQVEGIKKQLSKKATYNFNISSSNGVDRIEVSADEFKARTEDLVEKTINFVQALLNKNNMTPDDVDIVLLVGGSTKMPMIKEAVEAMFPGDKKVRVEKPDLAVAMGAALKSAMKVVEIFETQQKIKEEEAKGITSSAGADSDDFESQISLVEKEKSKAIDLGISAEEIAVLSTQVPENVKGVEDILSRSFGPAVLKDNALMINNLLFVGDAPGENTATYYTPHANLPSLRIPVYENVSKDAFLTPSEDLYGNPQATDPDLLVNKLGEVILPLSDGTPEGAPIEVFFHCSEAGLDVRVKDIRSGVVQPATFQSSFIKSEEELEEGKAAVNMLKMRSN